MDTQNIIYYNKKKPIDSIGSVLSKKINKPKERHCAYEWQDRAFDIATKLGIDFKQPQAKRYLANWLRLFRNAFTQNKQGKLDNCYSFVVDYTKPLNSESKIRLFFWKFSR